MKLDQELSDESIEALDTRWECYKCTLYNESNLTKCRICETKKPL